MRSGSGCSRGSRGNVPIHLIDEPTPFDPLEVWKEHLRALLRIEDQRGEAFLVRRPA